MHWVGDVEKPGLGQCLLHLKEVWTDMRRSQKKDVRSFIAR